MVVTCDIEFENSPEAAYYAGQVVMGKVTLVADKRKQVKAVNLKINGSAKTRFKENQSGDASDKCYVAEVDYINTVTCLLAPKATDQSVVIEPGIHTFSFACHLPSKCPSSVEGNHGFIRYVVQVSLQRPWKFDQTFTKGFTVLAIADLNYGSPLLKLPADADITKHFCCGPCRMDALKLNIQLPQTGYVPGQIIPINILVTNNTVFRINEICARLVMVIKYFSTNSNNAASETKTISKLIGDPVLRNCKKNFNYLLPVPATPPTCMTLCSIIQITYRVEVEAKMQGIFYRNQTVHTPVTIGNVPLQMEGMVVQEQPGPKQLILDMVKILECMDEGSNDPSTINENKENWSFIRNMPPPVYKEAIHMPKAKLAEVTEHEYGENQFTPKYPVFDVPKPTILHHSNTDAVDGQAAPSSAMDNNNTTWL